MNFWLDHPSYRIVRDDLITYLRSDKRRFRRLAPVVFLCGGFKSPAREALRVYLGKYDEDLAVFYAEDAWSKISANPALNALQMEDYLARLADLVIVLVESPGTFTELGAFSLSEPLRKKLLPILDSRYKNNQSFIETGPVRWIDADSEFRPSIYVDLRQILTAVDQIEQRIKRIPKQKPTRVTDLASNPKQLLFFLCDLIAVIQPATTTMIESYMLNIVHDVSEIDVAALVGLGSALNLLAPLEINLNGVTGTFYYRTQFDALRKPFHHKKWLDLPTQRAIQASVLLNIPQARDALNALARSL